MINSFLVFNDPTNPDLGLHAASIQEWDQILKRNKTLPREQRRFFITDTFEDCGEIDCMYIETTQEEYNKWHSQKVYAERKRQYEEEYSKVSLQNPYSSNEGFLYEDVVPCDYDLEEIVLEGARIEALKNKLAKWKPWGVEMLEIYLSGKKEQATIIISKKYGVSTRQAQRWKLLFESYVKNFFEKY